MQMFVCPICAAPLQVCDRTLACDLNHCFDISRKGYVNLVPAQHRNSKAPGDHEEMVAARRRFLAQGYYRLLRECLAATLDELLIEGAVADLGCGEGYFTAALVSHCRQIYGVDVSKAAINAACRHSEPINWVVASTTQLPLRTSGFELAMVVMAPMSDDVIRILKPGGYLIRVTPAAAHLWEFKSLVYAQPRKHQRATADLNGFSLERTLTIEDQVWIEGSSLTDLLVMTPMRYRTAKTWAKTLAKQPALSLSVAFTLDVFKVSDARS